jgi:glycosyltransferase involved in cell wall biosynthesis
VLIFVVAYEAESTLAKVLDRIPESVFEHHNTEVLVIDDCSGDRTFEAGLRSSRASWHRITVLYNRQNQGYGGNQKLGYQYAIRHGYDYVVLVHGDGCYAPESIPAFLEPLVDGSADVVLGSRMLAAGAARRMPLYKFVGSKILTFLQNRLLGSRLSDFHSGFRAYRVSALEQIPFQYNTDVFHFDTEILIQLMLGGFRIAETPIPAYHGAEICRLNGIRYARNVLLTTILSRLQRLNIFYCRKFDVCRPGNQYYDLKLGYRSSHTMALDAVPSSARVLDIGCGPGSCAEELVRKGCVVSGMDQFAPEKARAFKDFFLWDESKPFPALDLRTYDFVLLLDIIEHLTRPEAFLLWLRRAARSFDGRPTFIVTSGNIAFFIIRLQALLGNFNYGKRGILDLTHSRLYTFASLQSLFEQCGFRVERLKGIPAPWPKALGLNVFTRFFVRLNDLLIRLSKGFFAYQIFLVATPTPTVDALLDDSIEGSSARAAALAPFHWKNAAPCYGDCLAATDQPTSSVP